MLSFPMTRGVRGAITIDINTEAAITEAACRLTQTMMAANQVTPGDIACIIFTVTSDLDAAFPAAGARQAGLTQTPLLCTNEIPVPDSLPRCIRALMLLFTWEKRLPCDGIGPYTQIVYPPMSRLGTRSQELLQSRLTAPLS